MRRIFVVLAVAGMALAPGGCVDAPTGPAGLEPAAALIVQANLAGTAIDALVITVTAPDIPSALVFNLVLTEGAAHGTLRLPAGSHRTFTAQAFDAMGIETHRGSRTAPVQPGVNPPLTLVLLPVEGEQGIELTIGSYQVRVTPEAARLAPGDTVRLAAAVSDAEGQPVESPVQWATLDPAIATVDPIGLVTAQEPGDALVAAVFAGVGAVARIAVHEP